MYSLHKKRLTYYIVYLSIQNCRSSRLEFSQLTSDKTLCAGTKKGTGPCNGDSGGGLYLRQGNRWSLRGIVSNSLKDPYTNSCNLKEYVVYTDTAKYLDWIKDVWLLSVESLEFGVGSFSVQWFWGMFIGDIFNYLKNYFIFGLNILFDFLDRLNFYRNIS